MKYLIALIVGATCSSAWAQVTPEEAYKRMEERRRLREAAATTKVEVRAGDLAGGFAHLRAGRYNDGIKLLLPIAANADLSSSETVNALHGLIYAYLKQEDFPKAKLHAVRLSRATLTNRSLQLNVLRVLMEFPDTVMEAIERLDREADANPTDEVIVDMLGAALSKANTYTRLQPRLPVYMTNYERYNLVLERSINEGEQDRQNNTVRTERVVETQIEKPDANTTRQRTITASNSSRARRLLKQKRWGTKLVDVEQYNLLKQARDKEMLAVRSAQQELTSLKNKLQSQRSGTIRDRADTRDEIERAEAKLKAAIMAVPEADWSLKHEPPFPDLTLK